MHTAGMTDLSIRQFVEAWRVFCDGAPNHSTEAAGGIHYAFSGVPVAFMNAAVVTERGVSAGALRDCAQRSRDWAAAAGVEWIFIVTREALAPGVDPDAILDACGFGPFMTLTGMIAADVAPLSRLPEGLALAEPDADADCEAIFDVNSAAYAMPLDACKPVWGRREFWANHHAALGRVDGEPASCAAVLMVDGYRYVALVATAPARQRRGYADAAMRRALELARTAHGDCPTFLHATDAGRPVYERMGYRAVCTHPIYIRKEFLAGH
jgi:GNAT superfamily N-acetyltransferase